MSGETEEHVSGWTVDTLRDTLHEAMRLRDVALDARFTAQEKAVELAISTAHDLLAAHNAKNEAVHAADLQALQDRDLALERLLAERAKQIEERFSGQEKAVASALTSAKDAVVKAENATEKRFEGVNEFRQALGDQARDFLPRREYDSKHEALTDRIAAIEASQLRAAGRNSGIQDGWGYLVGAVGSIMGIIGLVFAVRGH